MASAVPQQHSDWQVASFAGLHLVLVVGGRRQATGECHCRPSHPGRVCGHAGRLVLQRRKESLATTKKGDSHRRSPKGIERRDRLALTERPVSENPPDDCVADCRTPPGHSTSAFAPAAHAIHPGWCVDAGCPAERTCPAVRTAAAATRPAACCCFSASARSSAAGFDSPAAAGSPTAISSAAKSSGAAASAAATVGAAQGGSWIPRVGSKAASRSMQSVSVQNSASSSTSHLMPTRRGEHTAD